MSEALDPREAAPPTLDHVIGQKRAVQQLRTALNAYYNDRPSLGDDVSFPHVLLVGPAGVGKSLLSGIIAAELGTRLHEELAQNVIAPETLQGLLMLAEGGDVVFLDEIHELMGMCQTTLYRCLEERRLFLGGDRKSITLPPFTFVGATTDEWRLTRPLRDRFKIVLRLEHYSETELTQVIAQRCRRLGWAVEDEAVRGIAVRGRNTPRLAIRLLEAARRTARAEGEGADRITHQHLLRACEIEGYDALGLDPVERAYLELLREGQGPVRLNVIATRLSLPRRTIESVVEQDLLRLGLITKSDEGRMLTAVGVAHLTQMPQH